MKNITKAEARTVFKDFEIFKNEVFSMSETETETKKHYIEYYVWYNMLISFAKNKRNNILYIKFEGEIPIALIEYIEKRYPDNEILALFPRDKEDLKDCYNLLIDNIKDLYIFLKESRNYWIRIQCLEEEMLALEDNIQRKKLIS